MASEFEVLSKKFAVILHERFGFRRGDWIHFCVGNENLLFPLIGGAWLLGGVASIGGVALGPKAIYDQASTKQVMY